jgi:UrcA family protein
MATVPGHEAVTNQEIPMKTSIASIDTGTLRKAALIALAFAAMTAATVRAHAEEPIQITISAPATKIVGRYPDLTPIEQVTVSAQVPFRPAALTADSGVKLLKERVLQAARHVCWATDQEADDSDEECVLRTMRSAEVQINAAVARAKANEAPVAQR